MQFHLNGFRPGDPDIHAANESATDDSQPDSLPHEVDVLIIGCGPAGLTLAAQLSSFPDIKTCIVEQKPGPMERGQADGVACRSMEMFNAFGFAQRTLREAYWVNETTFWTSHKTRSENINRSGQIQDVEEGLSEFPHVILNQARVHDCYLEFMRNSASRLQPFYSRKLTQLDNSASDPSGKEDYPVVAVFEQMDPDQNAQIETIRARYLVGCDGARSVVRRHIGLALEGDSANQAWGVMDVLAVTDFPDIRMKSLIQSANQGSMLIIPREGGYLVRLYVEQGSLQENERVSDRAITSEHLIATARKILHPFTLEVKAVVWWSVYEIGQRLCDKFDDAPIEAERLPHVFIAGDACHTHSPKAGQGMNVSMQDAFNLGWKLASVLRQQSKPDILHTYSAERQKVAKQLIDFDREWSKIISSQPENSAKNPNNNPENKNPSISQFQEYFVKSGRYTAGIASQYQPSIITGVRTYQQLATGFNIGSRLHSAPVIRLSDAKYVHLGHTVQADGRWRVFLFNGEQNPADTSSTMHVLCRLLTDEPESPLKRYTPGEADIDNVIDVRAVFQQNHRDLELSALPALLLPEKGRFGLVDYEKAFCAVLKNGKDIFESRGIDRKLGCMLVVRPDQHIAHVLPLNGYRELTAFFNGFMLASV